MTKIKNIADLVLDTVDDVHGHAAGDQVAFGHIYNDLDRNRFDDGTFIRTSLIESIYGEDGRVFIETRNTIYRLITVEEI